MLDKFKVSYNKIKTLNLNFNISDKQKTPEIKSVKNIIRNPNDKNIIAIDNSKKSPINRTLDIFGIDKELYKNLSSFNKDVENALLITKKQEDGKIIPKGAFVSQAGQYGNFKFLSPKSLAKYQSEEVAVISFKNAAQLKELSETYSKMPLPSFFVEILNDKKCCEDIKLYDQNQNLSEFIPPSDDRAHGFLIAPNLPYLISNETDTSKKNEDLRNTYVTATEKLKNKMEGIILCTYAIHPSINSSFLNDKSRSERGLFELDNENKISQKTIEEKTGIKPLTSILDLTPEDVGQLEYLKEKTLQHLQRVYGTDDKDDIRMFFHFPVAEKTATLHLHTWVNKGDHPLNEPRSFKLDDIIKHLKDNKKISDLVLRKNGGTFYLPTSDSIKNIEGIPYTGNKENPLLLDFNSNAIAQKNGNAMLKDVGSTRIPSTSRALDIYGIDYNQENSRKSSTQVLVNRENLNSGAYISTDSDPYGEFRYLTGPTLKKYQTKDLIQVTFSKNDLDELQETYKNMPATAFLVDFLKCSGKSSDNLDEFYKLYEDDPKTHRNLCEDNPGILYKLYKRNPEIFCYSSRAANSENKNSFIIYPNIPYISSKYTKCLHKELAKSPEGIQLLAWAVHPSLPQNLVNEMKMEVDKVDKLDISIARPSYEKTYEINQKSAEEKFGVKVLTSILDLEKGDVKLLKDLKADIIEHLWKSYGVSPENDKINMFFHFPVAEKTATLHLHIWVNKGDHPLNQSRAFDIDEVIQHLENNQHIDSLILSRNKGRFILPKRDNLHLTNGMPNSQTPSEEDIKKFSLPM